MNPTQKFLASALLTAAALAASLPLKAMARSDRPEACHQAAGPEGHGRHGGHGGDHAGQPGEPMPPYLRGLKLSESQRDQIFELMHGQAPQLRDIAKKARQSVDQLHRQALGDSYDGTQARQLADEAGRAHGEMLARRAEIDRKIYAILDAEQRQQVAARIAARP